MSTSATPPSTPRVALITGATGGIGHATSLALAHQGYTLALHYNSASPETQTTLLNAVLAAQKSADPATTATAALSQADMSIRSSVAALHAAVSSQLGSPAILFLNAGTTGSVSLAGSIDEVSLDDFEATWRVNALAPYQLAQLCVPAMCASGFGRVVFCSSVAGITGGVVGPHYASSKAALHGLVHWLAPRVAGKGVTVNAVAPALIERTGMLPGGDGDGAGSREGLKARIPVGRFGMPEEVAGTVVWMVGNGYVTNKVVAVDGGFTHS